MSYPFARIYVYTQKKQVTEDGAVTMDGFTMNPISLQTFTMVVMLHWQLPEPVRPAIK